MAGDVDGEVEQVLLLLACGRKSGEVFRIDDDVARRAGHLAFAGAFEGLAVRLGDVEQAFADGRFDLAHLRAVRGDEADLHAAKLRCRPAAFWMMVRAGTSSSSLV